MTAVLHSEGALDLSSKPFDSKPPSPARSIGSDMDLKYERPSSVSSEGEEVLSSPPKKRPYPQFSINTMSSSGMPPVKSPRTSPSHSPGSLTSTPRSTTSPPTSSNSPTGPRGSSPTTPTSAGPTNGSSNLSPTSASRPFKMYPFEPMPNMYSQLAAAASTGMYPYGTASPTPGMPGMSLFDSAISLSSPIGQYLQQKKRRMENRHLQTQSGVQMAMHHPGGGGGGGSVGMGDIGYISESQHIIQHQAKASSPGSAPSSGTSGIDDSDMMSDHGGDSKSVCSDAESTSSMMLTVGGKKIKPVPDNKKDEAYWERRRKNNEAAKRSRDARRAKEEEIALRAAFLEQENLKLRAQVAILKNETAKLHYMLYNRM